mmetsp:Transcript_10709/g.40089  ORF Transcript_10709/g.40089 Transcript_10709/m.40089 type:complete len:325 (+) Transcript_10709:585-1559(+)
MEEVAIKVERIDTKKMVLKLEVITLKKLQSCRNVVRYIHSGRQEHFNFLVMERLGHNLADIRKRCPSQKFSLATTLKLGVMMIDCIQEIHKLGYLHRDVKPSNFVVGRKPGTENKIFLIDFNLARRFKLSTGDLRPPRKHAGFRGTARYASINSHKCKELGRRDDFWSIFYVLIEFSLGALPWRKLKSKEQIGELKQRYTNPDLVKDLPQEFRLFLEHLEGLSFYDEPDYDYLTRILIQANEREGFDLEGPFDWNRSPQETMSTASKVTAASSTSRETGVNKPVVTSPSKNPEFSNIYKSPQRPEGDNDQSKGKKKGCICCTIM